MGRGPHVGEEKAMFTIKVKCFNQYTNENVCKHFELHEESGRLCEVAHNSAYQAGTCDTFEDAMCRAVELCKKHGLIVLCFE